jgi:hypothetical protein
MGLCWRVESYLDKNGALPACSLVNRATSDRENTKMIHEKLFFLKIIHDSGTPCIPVATSKQYDFDHAVGTQQLWAIAVVVSA